ncbi:MAG: glycoside hydrolase family 97 C-terminal domain-containing protein, partial [Prevotellaceae bacterium]|nr:glycoside hydrolase family 97 C-terminal domain-containing protein [Prevotellaceae bacterium]
YHMALFVVFESGVQMLCDSPTRYYAEPQCTEFVTSVPTTWDETRVIDARMGQYVIVAKRKGAKWFVGAITGENPQQLKLSLNFIGGGKHRITYFEDGVNADRMAADYRRVEAQVDQSSVFDLRLAPNGGWCAVIE